VSGRHLALVAVGVAVAGCGSEPSPPPAAEPASSPRLTTRPAGIVVPVGSMPEGVVVDPVTSLAAVGLRNPDRLALVDSRDGRVIRRVALPESPRHLALEAPGGPVLVPAERANALVRVVLASGRVSSVTVGRFPHDAAATGGRVIVGNEMGDSVSVLAGRTRVATLPAPTQPGGVAPLPGGVAAVLSVGARKLTLFGLSPPRTLASIDAGVGPTHVVSAEDRLYVADTEGDAVLAIRVHPRLEIQGRASAPGSPYGIAVDARRKRLWATLTARNRLVEYRIGGPAPVQVASFATVRQPNSVAVDPRTGAALVAGRASGELQIVRPKG
jgi:DNA-binding beta-propeller fold protein YncE